MIDLVEVREFMSLILECLGSQEYKEATKDMSNAEKSAAMWGASFCAIYANINANHYITSTEVEDERKNV